MKILSLTLTNNQIQKLVSKFSSHQISTKPHMDYFIKLNHGSICVYTSKKVVFQGEDAISISKEFSQIIEHSGSDEVGTGDYFGPLVVCACYVNQAILDQISDLDIKDSKQLTDQKILGMGKILQEKVPHSVLVLPNDKYNQIHKTLNLNAIKAQMHQKCYSHLKEKMGFLPDLCVVDQFTPEKKYYGYLNDTYHIDFLTFETKAENKYKAVAIAAIIARYCFLIALQQLSQQYHMTFPKGAGEHVDEFAIEFIKKHGLNALNHVSKYHFKNTERILSLLN